MRMCSNNDIQLEEGVEHKDTGLVQIPLRKGRNFDNLYCNMLVNGYHKLKVQWIDTYLLF